MASWRPIVYVNGHFEAVVQATDRGLAYGDGLFETMAVDEGVLALWPWHRERLSAGLQALMIELDEAVLEPAVRAVLQRAQGQGWARGTLKLIVSRGIDPAQQRRGYGLFEDLAATLVLIFYPDFSSPTQEDVSLFLCQQTLGINPSLAGIKHLNRLEYVLARAEWSDSRYRDGVLCHREGSVVEACSSNLFVVSDGALLTPELALCGVKGVMRRIVMEKLSSHLELPVREVQMSLPALGASEEVFITNAVAGISAVTRIGSAFHFSPGKTTRALQMALKDFLRAQRAGALDGLACA